MARDKSRREQAFQFVRYVVCHLDPVKPDSELSALQSAQRLRAFEAAKLSIHQTWLELCAIRKPARRLPEPILHSITVSAKKPSIRSAMQAASNASASNIHLVRLVVHSGLEGGAISKEIERAGIQLLISASPPSDQSPQLGWLKPDGALSVVRVLPQDLTDIIHDVTLDVWMGNFIDEPYATNIREHLYGGSLFRQKVAFAIGKTNGSNSRFGPIDNDAGYVALASIARGQDGKIDLPTYLTLWQEFAMSLPQLPEQQSQPTKVPAFPVDKLGWCEYSASVVERGVRRSIRLSKLRGQLSAAEGSRVVALVLLRPAVSKKQGEQLRGLGLRKINSTAVFNAESEEWRSFRMLAEDLHLMGRIAIFSFDRR